MAAPSASWGCASYRAFHSERLPRHLQSSRGEQSRREDQATRIQATGRPAISGLNQKLSHQTHLRIKNFIRGVFAWAIADGAFDGSNPMEETKAGGWSKKSSAPEPKTERERKIRESNEHAYTLVEVAEMFDKLPEPARTVCAVAAFTS